MAKKSTKARKSAEPDVKKGSEVISSLQRNLAHNLHGRYNLGFSKKTREKLVSYGPWISVLIVAVILPQLLILSKSGQLISFSGFFEKILFNQESWVILIVLFCSVLLLVDGISQLFEKRVKGWTRIYQIALLNGGYILWQLFDNLSQPAAPILSLLGIILLLFALLDIRQYYK